jgi:hypothetical protein
LSNAKKEEMYCDADEIKTFGNEAPISTGRVRDLLNRIDITTPLEFKIKEFHTLDEKSTRQSWRSSVDLMWLAVTRVQLSKPLTRMQ